MTKFELSESIFEQNEMKGFLTESDYKDIYDKVSCCMSKINSEDDFFVFIYKDDYIVDLGYNRHFTESGPDGEFLTVISIATEEDKEMFSEEPICVGVETRIE